MLTLKYAYNNDNYNNDGDHDDDHDDIKYQYTRQLGYSVQKCLSKSI